MLTLFVYYAKAIYVFGKNNNNNINNNNNDDDDSNNNNNNNNNNKKAELSQRWLRYAPYVCVPWKFSGVRPRLLFPKF